MFGKYCSATLLAFAVVLGGCASKSGDVYTRDQARQEMRVRMGTIQSIRTVELEGSESGAGTIAGGAIGGIAGSSVGRGNGSVVGAIVGAVVGGVAGNALERKATTRPALELTVGLDGGRTIAVVQEGAPDEFRVGDRVRVLDSGRDTRVSR
jgi:outer membrane lipoprotein SlyB